MVEPKTKFSCNDVLHTSYYYFVSLIIHNFISIIKLMLEHTSGALKDIKGMGQFKYVHVREG